MQTSRFCDKGKHEWKKIALKSTENYISAIAEYQVCKHCGMFKTGSVRYNSQIRKIKEYGI